LGVNESANPHVVIAEDDHDIRELMCDVLARHGINATGASQLAEALKLAEERPPDVLVVDLHLPDASGAQAVAAFRAVPELDGLPILVVSAEVRGPALAEAMAAGANSYLPKPFSSDGLAEAVVSLVRERD
jgi:DNA-binding response OmpR family regulator